MNRISISLIVLLVLPVMNTHAAVVYTQPPSTSGGLYHSSWWDPDGSDYDQYVWDGFTLTSTQAITEIRWRGGFDPAYFGAGGAVIDFTVEIWSSIGGGSQPDIGSVFQPNPLVHFSVGGDAGQTLAGTFGGVVMYDYHFALPTPFVAAAGVKYWVQIEAAQFGIPDWSITVASSGDGNYFRRIANVGDIFYQIVPGNAAFTLLTVDPPNITRTNDSVVLTWPTSAAGWVLQQNTDLSTPNWVSATNTVNVVGDQNQMTVSPLPSKCFYRLMHP